MTKLKVGVLRGGPSSHYDESLASGAHILKHMPEAYMPVDVFIDKNGTWYVGGYEIHPRNLGKHIDVAWNALHGEYGEDGEVQHFLGQLGVPHTGSKRLPAALSWNKPQMKDVYERHEIKTPKWMLFDTQKEDDRRLLEVFRTFANPSVVKPTRAGFSRGVSVARSFDELKRAVAVAGEVTPTVLIEVFVPGKHVTAVVVEGFRGEKHYVPSHAEMVEGEARFRSPALLAPKEASAVLEMAKGAHHALGLRHYSQSDFIVSPRGVYIIETDSQPDMREDSPLAESLGAVGIDLTHVIDHVLKDATR